MSPITNVNPKAMVPNRTLNRVEDSRCCDSSFASMASNRGSKARNLASNFWSIGLELLVHGLELGLELGIQDPDGRVYGLDGIIEVSLGDHALAEFIAQDAGQTFGLGRRETGTLQAVGELQRVDHGGDHFGTASWIVAGGWCANPVIDAVRHRPGPLCDLAESELHETGFRSRCRAPRELDPSKEVHRVQGLRLAVLRAFPEVRRQTPVHGFRLVQESVLVRERARHGDIAR